MKAGELLTRQVGPLPMGVWLLVGAGGLFIASRKDREPELVTDVREVPVPVGAIASPDGAPVVITPIIRLPDTVTPATPAPGPVVSIPRQPAPRAYVPPAVPAHNADAGILASGDRARIAARIAQIFRNRGVTVGTDTEHDSARIARITDEVLAGRSFDSVRASVDRIAASS